MRHPQLGTFNGSEIAAVANLATGNVDATHNQVLTTAQLAAVPTTAEKAVIGSLASGGWADLQAKRLAALAVTYSGLAALTGFRAFAAKVSGSGVTDGGLAGGAASFSAGAFVPVEPTGPNTIINPKTSVWAFGYRALCPSPGGGEDKFVVLYGGGMRVGICAAAPTTVAVIHSHNGANGDDVNSSFSFDNNRHDFMLCSDATTCRLVVDGVVVGSTTNLAYFPTTNCALCVYMLSGLGTLKMQQAFYAWVP